MWALLYCIVLYESAAIQHFFVNMKYKYVLKYLFIIPCINTVHHLGILIESAKKYLYTVTRKVMHPFLSILEIETGTVTVKKMRI